MYRGLFHILEEKSYTYNSPNLARAIYEINTSLFVAVSPYPPKNLLLAKEGFVFLGVLWGDHLISRR